MSHLTGLSNKVTDIRLDELEKEVKALKKAQITDGEVEGGILWLVTFDNKGISCGTIAPARDSITGGYKSSTGYLYLKRYAMTDLNCGFLG